MRRHIRIQHFKELDLDLVDFCAKIILQDLQSGYKLLKFNSCWVKVGLVHITTF